MLIRRRPLLRTAVVAGTVGAVAGHAAAKTSAHEAQQDAQMAQMQKQTHTEQMEAAKIATLGKLKKMLDQGVLTQQEFDTERAKILHGAESANPCNLRV